MWLDEEQNKTNINGQPANNGNNISVGAGGGAAQPGQQSSSGTTGNPSTINPIQPNKPSQDFATVQDYLGANKQQGEDLGQKFTTGLTEAANKDKTTIDTATAGAQNDITAGTAAYDPTLTQKALSDPTSVANDPGQLNSFLKQWNASYAGPKSFESSSEYMPAAAAANDAATKAAEVSTAGGQQQILQDKFNVYGQGNKGLDQAILQNSSAYPTIQKAQPAFQSINDYLGSQATATNAKAQQAQAASDAAKTNTQGVFADNLTKFQTDLNTRTAASKKAAQDVLTKYQGDLASADPSKIQADLQASGVDAATTKNITDYLTSLNTNYGIKPNIPSSYIGNPSVDINSSTVATPEDYAKAAAYGKLTGTDYSGVLNPADISKAGTGTFPQQAFKSGDLQGYLKGGLDTQDKSLLATKPTLDWNSVNSEKFTSQQGNKMVQDILDAGKRQGVDPHNNPTLDSLHSNAMQGLQAVMQGHGSLDRPSVRTYADTAVAALVGKGMTKQDAQKSINDWTDKFGYGTTPIYKDVHQYMKAF